MALGVVLCLLSTAMPCSAKGQQSGLNWGPWHQLAPLETLESSSDSARPQELERELVAQCADAAGPQIEREYAGFEEQAVAWEKLELGDEVTPWSDQNRMDLTKLSVGSSIQTGAYFWRSLDAAQEVEVDIEVGASDGIKFWLNGKLLFERKPLDKKDKSKGRREFRPNQFVHSLRLREGRNHILVQLTHRVGRWQFQLMHGTARNLDEQLKAQVGINEAIDRGVVFLLRSQHLDGSWRYHSDLFRNGITSLALYTLLEAGLPSDHQAIRRGFEFLQVKPPVKTYSAACQLLALGSLQGDRIGELDIDAAMEELVDLILDWESGGWAYPDGESDLSNTHFGALGLRAAAQRGIPIPLRIWQRLVTHVRGYQNTDGGFGYKPGTPSTGSMTTAGLTLLSVCREQLRQTGKLTSRFEAQFEADHARGLEWLSKHFAVHENPEPSGSTGLDARWLYYYLYGIERVAAMGNLRHIGPHDWYWDGARALLASQEPGGFWDAPTPDRETEPNTCFALLFLERATETGRTGAREARYGGPRGDRAHLQDVQLRIRGTSPVRIWIHAFGPYAVEKYGWPRDRGKGLRVEKVEYFSNGKLISTIPGDIGAPTARGLGTEFDFKTMGIYQISARVHLILSGRSGDARTTVLNSPTIPVDNLSSLESWMLEYATSGSRNRIVTKRAKAQASSEYGEDYVAAQTLDNMLCTSWLCAPGDLEPELEIQLPKPSRANRILITPAIPAPWQPDYCARPLRVALTINEGRATQYLDFDPASPRKQIVELKRTENIRSLRLSILERAEGKTLPSSVGFAEVELQLE